ncbi:MAG TPA: hypothetical protein VHZ98_06775 [Galbitalea sp.]|nr:hypothetical protein [Galbitalea sp.]
MSGTAIRTTDSSDSSVACNTPLSVAAPAERTSRILEEAVAKALHFN